MPKAKKVIEPKIETVEEMTYQVFDAKGNIVRDYKTSISGPDCKAMAEELAREIGGTVK